MQIQNIKFSTNNQPPNLYIYSLRSFKEELVVAHVALANQFFTLIQRKVGSNYMSNEPALL